MPLVTIEGLDGAGKTTLAAGLVTALRGRGVDVELLREPGGVELSERVRALGEGPGADRRRARRGAALRRGTGAARRAGAAPAARRRALRAARPVRRQLARLPGRRPRLGVDAVRAINDFGTGGLQPDRTLYLRIDPAEGRARQAGRGAAPDRLEQEDAYFFATIASAYDAIAEEDPERVRVIDASGSADEVLASALAALDDLGQSE